MKKQLALVAMLALGSSAALAQSAPDGSGNGGCVNNLIPDCKGAACSSGLIFAQAKPDDGRNGSNTYHLPECKGAHCPWLLVDGGGNGGGGGTAGLVPDYPESSRASGLILVWTAA